MKQVNKAAWMPVGIGAGIAIGAGIGAATDNLAMWLALGVASGSGLPPCAGRRRGRRAGTAECRRGLPRPVGGGGRVDPR